MILPTRPMAIEGNSASLPPPQMNEKSSPLAAVHQRGNMTIAQNIRSSHNATIAMRCRHTLLFLLAALTSVDVSAWSRMGHAAVITEAGLPCFKIANEEERSRGPVRLKMLTISTPGPNGWENVWTVMFPNASFGDPAYRLPNRGCVRYGKAPEGAESSDATPLVAGKVYGVSFLGRPPSASDPTSRYSADFCLLTAPAGGFQVVQLTNGKANCASEAKPR